MSSGPSHQDSNGPYQPLLQDLSQPYGHFQTLTIFYKRLQVKLLQGCRFEVALNRAICVQFSIIDL